MQDANSHTTTYTYENMDRLATRTDALNRAESYQYDQNGNLSQFTDRRGKVTTYMYDNLNRRIFAGFGTQAGPTYESTINYTWDAGNRLTQVVDSVTGTITRGYDGLDKLTSEQTPQGTVSYTYDAAGRRQTMTVAGQTAVNYTFDNANRLTNIAQGTTTIQLGYDSANRRTALTLPNGIVVSYGYDNASELTGLTYTLNSNTVGNLSYTYDMAGRRTGVGGSYARTGLPSAQATTGYDAANELTTWGTATPTYDANGNVLSDGTNSYVWNTRNQLASMDMSAESFLYDPLGRRVAKTILGTTTNYLYDGANPVQELSGATPTANLLTAGVDEYFQRTDSSGPRDFLSDALGSTLALSDSTGTIQASYTYEPFGNTTITGTSSNPYQYTGRENDGVGIYFYRARYYSPALQRFLSEDPLQFATGPNFYQYAFNDPVAFEDPIGLSAMSEKACNRRECHHVYQAAVYGDFVGNTLLPTFSAFSYVPGSGHAAESWLESPLTIGKILTVQYLQGAAAQNVIDGTWFNALADLASGSGVSGYLGMQGEAALNTAAWQEFGVAVAEDVLAPLATATIITETIQDGYVWAHCW